MDLWTNLWTNFGPIPAKLDIQANIRCLNNYLHRSEYAGENRPTNYIYVFGYDTLYSISILAYIGPKLAQKSKWEQLKILLNFLLGLFILNTGPYLSGLYVVKGIFSKYSGVFLCELGYKSISAQVRDLYRCNPFTFYSF